MPQQPSTRRHVYEIQTPKGTFEVESARELSDAELLDAAGKYSTPEPKKPTLWSTLMGDNGGKVDPAHFMTPHGQTVAGYARGARDLVRGAKTLLVDTPVAAYETAKHLLTGGEQARAAIGGFKEGAASVPRAMVSDPGSLVGAGHDTANEPGATRGARAFLNIGATIAGPKLVKGAKARIGANLTASRTARAAADAEVRAAARALAGDIPDEVVAAGLGDVTKRPNPTGARLVKGTARPATPVSVEDSMARALQDVRDTLAKEGRAPRTDAPPPPYSLGARQPPEQPRTSVAGRPSPPPPPPPPAGGKLNPTKNPPPTIEQTMADALAELRKTDGGDVRAGEAPGNAAARAEAAAEAPREGYVPRDGRRAPKAPGTVEQKETGQYRAKREAEVRANAAAAREKPKVRVQGDRTIPLNKAARDEVQAMRRLMGAERVSRKTGIPIEAVRSGGPSRTPLVKEASILDNDYRRMIDDPRGFIKPEVAIPMGGAAAGAVAAPLLFDEDDSPDGKLRKILMSAAAGAGGAHLLRRPSQIPNKIMNLRVESMLSGAAIPKNIMTGAGAAITAGVEGELPYGTTLTGAARLNPAKEMLRLPTNLRTAVKAWKNPPSQPGFVSGQPTPRGVLPRLIGSIDETARQALQRAGLTAADIDRLLLTAPNSLAAVGGDTPVGRFILPFQRTPANAVREGMREMSGLERLLPGATPHNAPGNLGKRTRKQAAMTAGSVVAGTALGEWVKQDPKRRGPLAAILVAAMGPRTLPMTMGGMFGASGYGRSALGGMSPVPEFAFDPKTMSGFPPSGLKLWQRLFGGGDQE